MILSGLRGNMSIAHALATRRRQVKSFDEIIIKDSTETNLIDLIRHRRRKETWIKRTISTLKWVFLVMKQESWRLRK
jgi:hypothetical protein